MQKRKVFVSSGHVEKKNMKKRKKKIGYVIFSPIPLLPAKNSPLKHMQKRVDSLLFYSALKISYRCLISQSTFLYLVLKESTPRYFASGFAPNKTIAKLKDTTKYTEDNKDVIINKEGSRMLKDGED